MTPTTHSPDTLAQMTLTELWDLYEQVLGERSKAPNRKFLIGKIVAAQEERAAQVEVEVQATPPTEAKTEAETETPDAGPWSATSLDDRLALVRAQASTTALEALLAAPAERAVQTRVHAEAGAQKAALAQVEQADVPALKALLGNQRTHTRPGVLVAVKARLQALGADEAQEERPLGGLSVEELQVVYETEVRRGTGSSHKGYLVWKIREARKGRITLGEVKRAAGEVGAEYKVLAVRMEVGELEALDRAWQAGGYESRVAFIREAVSAKVAGA